jgi:hypothetical protein
MKRIIAKIRYLLVFFLLLMPVSSLALSPGDKAPPFTTPSSQGEISLGDYTGAKHVVLALYFAVFTSV